jgi:hypothetical protein
MSITSCSKEENVIQTSMPDDFALSFSYGPNENQYNILDTYTGIIQKDLIANGKDDVDYIIPEDDLNEIYSQICKYKIYGITDYMKSSNFFITPTKLYEIKFTINGVDYNVTGDYSAMFNQENSEQADNFCDFVTYMTEYIESTEEYKSMPEPVGGYQ